MRIFVSYIVALLVGAILLFSLNGCGDKNNTQPLNKNTIILDQDSWDGDNYNFATFAVYLDKQGVDVTLLQTEANGFRSSWMYKAILSSYNPNNTVSFGVSLNSNDRGLPKFKASDVLQKSGYIYTYDKDTSNAYSVLENKLETSEDNSITYVIGGKLIFLSKFLSDPARLELFKLKVKEVIFGLGCDMTNSVPCRDFNLAMNNTSWKATVDVYNKLHNQITLSVGSAKYGNQRVYDFYKNTKHEELKIIYGNTNRNVNYGDISLGDLDSILPASGLANYTTQKGILSLGNKRFIFKQGKGNDKLYIIKDDIVGILTNIIKNLE